MHLCEVSLWLQVCNTEAVFDVQLSNNGVIASSLCSVTCDIFWRLCEPNVDLGSALWVGPRGGWDLQVLGQSCCKAPHLKTWGG